MILAKVNLNHITIQTNELLTSGSVNVNEVKFSFSADWNDLSKTAIFKTTKKTKSIILTTDSCIIPWEVLADAGEALWVGVYGTQGKTMAIPTIWAKLGRVLDGAELDASDREPTPDVYAQILLLLNQKIDTPAVEGVAGQVLGLDSDLNPTWINQTRVVVNYDDTTGELTIGGSNG